MSGRTSKSHCACRFCFFWLVLVHNLSKSRHGVFGFTFFANSPWRRTCLHPPVGYHASLSRRKRVVWNEDHLSNSLLQSHQPYRPLTSAIHSQSSNTNNSPASSKLLWAPLYTILASGLGLAPITQPLVASTIGQIPPLQAALALLMLAMGLTITPQEVQSATQQPTVLGLNLFCCFGIMPLMAWGLAKAWRLSPSQTIGTLLLGCVSGGQASNLFSLLAGGDVALSVICTLSTTLLGVMATPFLIQILLGTTVPVQAIAMLRSVVSLVLVPLVSGLLLGRVLTPTILQHVRKLCPSVGLAATMLLVAGGASNASLTATTAFAKTIGVSFSLPMLGGLVAWTLAPRELSEPSKRTLVIEVLSKSPTLAHVLALRHFGPAAAAIPAVSMVSLALLGALVASGWQWFDPQ